MIEIKFNPAQNKWLEVSWVEIAQAPDVLIPAVPEVPAVYEMLTDDMGSLVPGKLIRMGVPEAPEYTEPGEITHTEVKHTSYHPTQVALLQADAAAMGTPLTAHANMLTAWAASYVPPAPELTPVPAKVTMRQARLALLAVGKLAAVTAAINALPRPQKEAAQIEWEYSQEVQRHNGLVSLLAPALGMSSADLDQLFITAAEL